MACSECVMGALHEGTPLGREEVLHGIQTYITEPPPNTTIKSIIVFIPDALGWKFNNNRILADKYAIRTNSIVYLPEFMDGHAMDISLFSSMDTLTGDGWMIGKILPLAHAISSFIPFMFYTRLAVTQPRVFKFFHSLRNHEAAHLPLCAAGFCWGGKFVFLLCSDSDKTSDGKSLIDCGFAAHPSNLVLPTDAENVQLPLSVAVGDVDALVPIAQVNQMKEILEKKGNETHELVVYPGAKHGFAIRAHPGDEEAFKQGRQAEEQAVSWFNRCIERFASI